MSDHMKQSQTELNELLKEYWKLRHATGVYISLILPKTQNTHTVEELYMETLANKLGLQVVST